VDDPTTPNRHRSLSEGPPDHGDADDVPPTLPSRTALLLAFLSVVLAGIFGAVIGYGIADVGATGNPNTARVVGTLIGAAAGAGGVGVVAILVLRAMAEWRRPRR
jgi:hypothetical protein